MNDDWVEVTCDEDLYAVPGAAVVRCRGCGAEYDAEAQRRWLIATAYDSLATATVVSRALTSLGEPVTPSTIRNLAARNQLYAHSVDRDGYPLYRVGEVVEILVRRRTKKQQVQISA